MELLTEWPEEVDSLVINGDGPRIYYYIQSSANSCLEYINLVRDRQDVASDFLERWFKRVQMNFKLAGELRFKVTTSDNRLEQRKKTNFSYRRLAAGLQAHGVDDNNRLLLGILTREGDQNFPADIVSFVKELSPFLRDALRVRIEMLECWEEIIDASRKVAMERLVCLSHLLTEVAIQLQDDSSINQVRSLLSGFKTELQKRVDIGPLPSDPLELKKILEEGIAELKSLREQVLQFEERRLLLSVVKQDLETRLDQAESASDGDSTDAGVVKRRESSSAPRSRMIFRKEDE
ncbi:MAG: hypothetical protein GC154_08375 [bacterium]|nr:hypothetical protein [bacterium]